MSWPYKSRATPQHGYFASRYVRAPSLQRWFMSAFRRAVGVALAFGRGERGDRSGLEPAVLADIAFLLATLVERMAALA